MTPDGRSQPEASHSARQRFQALNSPFLMKLEATKREHIFSLAERTAQALATWAKPFPMMRPVRLLPLALSVSAAAPFCDVPALLSTAKVSLWVFALDDLFDEEGLAQAQLRELAQGYRSIARGRLGGGSSDELSQALAQIRRDLSTYPLFAPLAPTWADALCGTIEEMEREADWREQYQRRGAAALPSYESYLRCGRYSIGGPPHVWSALVTIGDRTIPHHVGRLLEMEQMASECIRLANDLQTDRREREEGKVNGLIILENRFRLAGCHGDEAIHRAQEQLRADISTRLTSLSTLSSAEGTSSGRPEAAIINIAGFVCEFYRQHDYHTFAESQPINTR